jgi:hypothetical protein
LDIIALTKDCSDEGDVAKSGGQVKRDDSYRQLAEKLDPRFFDVKGEDKEHIFPQTPIGSKDLRGKKDKAGNPLLPKRLREYWDLLVKSRCEDAAKKNPTLPVKDEHKMAEELKAEWEKWWKASADSSVGSVAFPIDGDENQLRDGQWIDRLQKNEDGICDFVKQQVNDFVCECCGVVLNSIGNIVLLNHTTNVSYGNNFYTQKRQRIMSDYRRNLSIRLHTRSVFAKEFPGVATGEDAAYDAWDQSCIDANRKFIATELTNFFSSLTNDTGNHENV